ncbi:hypothetical protein AAMO2058_001378500 [Amorphochlora amoebiformis]
MTHERPTCTWTWKRPLECTGTVASTATSQDINTALGTPGIPGIPDFEISPWVIVGIPPFPPEIPGNPQKSQEIAGNPNKSRGFRNPWNPKI